MMRWASLTCMRLWVRNQTRASTNVTFSFSYVLSKFILDIIDIDEEKHREETWTYIMNTSLKSPIRLEQAW